MADPWQVYIILGDDGRFYTGITTDIERRWREHTQGPRGARYFRGRRPEQLCYLESHPDRSSASRREYAIKQLSRRAKEQLIATAPAPKTPDETTP
ncbi:GIY-YIG nuclease family protein [Marinimicrobium agarilyticum]|uniref:GIY-YIG nuclease family protein n=1 Tax=Marinimicrobium agarilyticum TaxID=306546 RepID=UPI0004277715|nr:GIY-YIG nuclease family protein [Marinimicrobium agarilyticum]